MWMPVTSLEEKVLVVPWLMSQAGEGWNSSAEQCCSCCAGSDERQQMEEAGRSFHLQR